MASPTVIALDAMGGDHAPAAIVDGAALARERYPDIRFIFFGDEAKIRPLLAKHDALREASEISHAPDTISDDAKPSIALRQGRKSSMRLAINAVANGQASSVVSAGNTGALLAMAKFVLKTLPGIDRPAIASLVPTKAGECVMLDLGANVECDAENLVQFALMGAIFSRTVMGISDPVIALLNIGTEELKGHDELRAAAAILRDRPIPGRFYGFVEGNFVAHGAADVVVTDGFSGNIVLKTIEGTAQLFSHYLKQAFGSSLTGKLGYLMARGALRKFKMRVDPRHYNGAMFLGLEGVCVKSHGATDAEGFANALGFAHDLVARGFNDQIRTELARHYGEQLSAASPETIDNEAG